MLPCGEGTVLCLPMLAASTALASSPGAGVSLVGVRRDVLSRGSWPALCPPAAAPSTQPQCSGGRHRSHGHCSFLRLGDHFLP